MDLTNLDEEGYILLPDVLSGERLGALRDHCTHGLGALAGGGTAHLPLEPDAPGLADALSAPRIREALTHLLGPDPELRRAECRAPGPGQGRQGLHADHPRPVPVGQYQVANVLLLLVDVPPELGATRLVSGSHRSGKTPTREQSNADAVPGEVRLAGPAGSAYVFNGHAWHGGSKNQGERPRVAVLATFQRRGAAG